jgi:ribonuclease HI
LGGKLYFKLSIKEATNNMAKLKTTYSLLDLAWEADVRELVIYGDSQMTINYIIGSNLEVYIAQHPLIRKVREKSHKFQLISFTLLYREFNIKANLLAKEVAQVILDTLHIKHSIKGLSLPRVRDLF